MKIQLTQKQIEAIILGSPLLWAGPEIEAARTIEISIDPKDLYFGADEALGPPGIIAQEDAELFPWISGLRFGIPTSPGAFLSHFADVCLNADAENYRILRPVIVQLKKKYPKYGGGEPGGAR